MNEEMEQLEQKLLDSPSARARFLADTVEILERNGIDSTRLLGSIDLTDGARFLGSLAASSVVITRSNTGKGTIDADAIINAATMVITRSNTGKGTIDAGPNINAAATMVITRSNTGKGTIDAGPNINAATMVITRSNTGMLRDIATGIREASDLMLQEVGAIEEQLKEEIADDNR